MEHDIIINAWFTVRTYSLFIVTSVSSLDLQRQNVAQSVHRSINKAQLQHLRRMYFVQSRIPDACQKSFWLFPELNDTQCTTCKSLPGSRTHRKTEICYIQNALIYTSKIIILLYIPCYTILLISDQKMWQKFDKRKRLSIFLYTLEIFYTFNFNTVKMFFFWFILASSINRSSSCFRIRQVNNRPSSK